MVRFRRPIMLMKTSRCAQGQGCSAAQHCVRLMPLERPKVSAQCAALCPGAESAGSKSLEGPATQALLHLSKADDAPHAEQAHEQDDVQREAALLAGGDAHHLHAWRAAARSAQLRHAHRMTVVTHGHARQPFRHPVPPSVTGSCCSKDQVCGRRRQLRRCQICAPLQ